MSDTHLDALAITNDLAVGGNQTVTGNLAVTGTFTAGGAYTPTADIAFGTAYGCTFRAATQKIASSATGQLDIDAATEVEITTTTVDLNGALDVSGTTALGDAVTLATDKKLQFRDTGLYINSSTDGQLDIDADTEVEITTTTVDLNGNLDVSGTTALGDSATFATDKKAIFRDSAQYIHSGAANRLDLVSDGSIRIPTLIPLEFRDNTNQIYSSTGGQLDIDATTEVEITTGTVDLNGALDVSGTTALGDDTTLATTKKIQFRDTGLYINSSTDGQLDIDADTELEITAPTLDINASSGVDISNALTVNGALSINEATTVATTKKVQFRDTGLYIYSSVDGQLDFVSDGEIEITPATNLDLNVGSGDFTVNTATGATETASGAMAFTTGAGGVADVAAAGGKGGDFSVVGGNGGAGSATQLGGEGASVNLTAGTGGADGGAGAGADGNVKINSDALVATTKKIQFRDTALFINSSVDGQLDIDADTEVEITTATVDLNGALDVSGTTALGDAATLATDKKLQFRDTGLYIYSESDGAMTVSSDGTFIVEAVTSAVLESPVAGVAIDETADGVIADKALCEIDASGDLVQGTLNSVAIVGVNCEGAAVSGTDPIILGTKGHFTGLADAKVEGGTHLKACTGGRVGRFITTTLAGSVKKTNVNAGLDFANQPANDGVTIVSDSAADTAKNVTIIGTTNGTDTVVVEVVATDGADGTTPVNSTKVDWGKILAIKNDSMAGTLTVSETSGGLAITTVTTGNTSKGVITLSGSELAVYNKAPVIVSDAASTKQIGLKGTTVAYVEQYDSQALNGSTDVIMNSVFNTVTEIYTGDLESTEDVILKVGAADDFQLLIGKAGPAGAAAKDADCIVII